MLPALLLGFYCKHIIVNIHCFTEWGTRLNYCNQQYATDSVHIDSIVNNQEYPFKYIKLPSSLMALLTNYY